MLLDVGVYRYIGAPPPTDWLRSSGASTTASWYGITSSLTGQVVVGFGYGNNPMYYSTDMGTTYTQSTGTPYQTVTNVVMDSNGINMLALGVNDGLFVSTDSGGTVCCFYCVF